MTLNELLFESYGWADAHAWEILAASLAFPAVGGVLSWLGKRGRTDADGRFIASTFVGVSLLAVTAEVILLVLARSMHGRSPLDVDVALLFAAPICLAGTLLVVRAVFPLSELGSIRTATDLGAFLLCCGALAWFFYKFRGWGLYFFGTLPQLLVLLAIAAFFVRRTYRRAFGVDRPVGGRRTGPTTLP